MKAACFLLLLSCSAWALPSASELSEQVAKEKGEALIQCQQKWNQDIQDHIEYEAKNGGCVDKEFVPDCVTNGQLSLMSQKLTKLGYKTSIESDYMMTVRWCDGQ